MLKESINLDIAAPYDYLRLPDGLQLRFGRWPSTSNSRRGGLVLLSGRSEFMEKYTETIGNLCSRGFMVFSFDWRGQGLSGRMLPDREKGYIESYDAYLRDLGFFLERIVYPQCPERITVLGHSMGAHILLRYLNENNHHIGRVILSAPMLGIETEPVPPVFVRSLSSIMVKCGWGHKSVIGSGNHTPFRTSFSNNRLTSDRRRFMRNLALVEKNPQLSAGHVTYAWLAATFRSLDLLKKNLMSKPVDVPALIAVAGNDRIVSNREIRRLSSYINCSRMIFLKGARHEILQEVDAVQSKFWNALDGFIVCT